MSRRPPNLGEDPLESDIAASPRPFQLNPRPVITGVLFSAIRLGDLVFDARADEIVLRGEFATWRTARAVGDYDLKTLLIRADPVETTAASLQPGMSVWLEPAPLGERP
jgi:hypothetical protein